MTLVAPQYYAPLGGSFIPVGVGFGQRWQIQGPDGTVAVFNDQTSANYVGAITDLTGFDSPSIRENADDLVQQDGGIHGDFFYGRRSISMTGIIYDAVTPAQRNVRIETLKRATMALRPVPAGTGPANSIGCSRISWMPYGGSASVFLDVRQQQPLRISGGYNKDFQVQMVAADPRIYSSVESNVSIAPGASANVINYGNTMTYPSYRVNGPVANFNIINVTTGLSILVLYPVPSGHFVRVDTLNRTVLLDDSTSIYGAVDFANTTWSGLVAGNNVINFGFTSFSGGTPSLQVFSRDAYM